MARENALTLRTARQTMETALQRSVQAMEINHQRLFAMTERDYVGQVLRRDGILPYLLDPEEKVIADIRALMKHTGMDQKQAIGWMAASGLKTWQETHGNGSGPIGNSLGGVGAHRGDAQPADLQAR